MNPTIEVDPPEYEALDLAASITGMTHAQVIARLIQQTRLPGPTPTQPIEDNSTVSIFADYAGYRTKANYNSITKRIDIKDGPLAGESFKSPSSAARAVVAHYKPDVSPHRNGWSFWMMDDGTRRFLQSIR